MKVITIRFENVKEWNFLLELLRRLNFKFEWMEEITSNEMNPNHSKDIVATLFGSFPSDKSSDDLVKSIYEARVNQSREISL